jgi:putative SOS response-associated peptidase YedK
VINARAETAATLPMFKGAAASRRCLVPASGFYEWEARGYGPKQPWHLAPEPQGEGASVFFLAGLWSPAVGGDRFVTLTAPTPEGFEPAIHHRMPLVVRREDGGAWLDSTVDARRALALAAPFGAPGTFGVRAQPVSTRVNSAANEGVCLLERAEPEAGLFG